MRWTIATIFAISCAIYLLVDGGTDREECLAEPVAGCLLDLAEESLPEDAGEKARSDLIRDIAVARAEALDFSAAYELAEGLQDERNRREVRLEIAREQAKAGQYEAGIATIEAVLGDADGEDADLKGKVAIIYAEIGNAPSALRIASQISDATKRKDNLASVYIALAKAGRMEFANYVAKFDFSGDSKRLEAHLIRLAELTEELAKLGETKTARSVLRAARQAAGLVASVSVSSALSAARMTLVAQTGSFDTALKLAKMNSDLQFRVTHVLSVAKAISKSGQGQTLLSTLDELMLEIRDVSEPNRRMTLLAFMATAYAVSGYSEGASDALSEIPMSIFRASAYGAVARWMLDNGQIEAAQVNLDLAVEELEDLERGLHEDTVARGVAKQLARAGRAKQALEVMLGITDTPSDISSAYVWLARELSESENARSPFEEKLVLAKGAADDADRATAAEEDERARPSPHGSGEANRLFVEAVQLYQQAAEKPEVERLAGYRRILAKIDRILDEFGDTNIAQRIKSGEPLGPLDLQSVRLAVENAGSDSG